MVQNSGTIIVGGDPDVRIQEEIGTASHKKVAIEVKGGTDKSNAHNRAGEAEKSHQKAKSQGYRDFWTIIAKMGLDLGVLKTESPTTNAWFDATQILGRTVMTGTSFGHGSLAKLAFQSNNAPL